jgi:hypothetical protein
VDPVTPTVHRPAVAVPADAAWVPLGPSGPRGALEAPDRLDIEVKVTGYGNRRGRAGLAAMRLHVELQAGMYRVTRLTADGPARGYLDIERVREFTYGPALRQALSGAVRLVEGDDVHTAANPVAEADRPLWRVALTYSLARATGANPTTAVAEDLGVNQAAAAQRVKRARQRGFLPPTTPGRTS